MMSGPSRGDRHIPKSVLKIGVKLPELVAVARAARADSTTTEDDDDASENNNLDEEREDLEGRDEERRRNQGVLPLSTDLRNVSESPFTKYDKKLFGKNLFRQKFTRFGAVSRQQWKASAAAANDINADAVSTGSNREIDQASVAKREQVRQELAEVIRSARGNATAANGGPVATIDDFFLSPKQVLERSSSPIEFRGSASVKIKLWPSTPNIAKDDDDADRIKKSSSQLTSIPSRSSAEVSLGVYTCARCQQPVYPLEKLEPEPAVRFHPHCFRCSVCFAKLTLANFCRSLQSARDPRFFCRAHQPKQDKVMLCKFSTRKSQFPAFKLSWAASASTAETSTTASASSARRT